MGANNGDVAQWKRAGELADQEKTDVLLIYKRYVGTHDPRGPLDPPHRVLLNIRMIRFVHAFLGGGEGGFGDVRGWDLATW